MTSETSPAVSKTVTYLKYIPFDEVPAYLLAGWQIKPLHSPHRSYAVLGVWPGDGEPPIPSPV